MFVDINECASHPCQNNGICHDKVGSYSCDCKAGFTGDKCQTGIILYIAYNLNLNTNCYNENIQLKNHDIYAATK